MTQQNIRTFLRIIRDLETTPSTILPNGQCAADIAHEYVLRENRQRNLYKKKKENGVQTIDRSTKLHTSH